MESALPPMLCSSCPAPFLPSPGASSCLFSLPVGGPPALKTAAGLPGHQASHSPVPQTQLPGQPGVPFPRMTSSDGSSCCQGMGALGLAVPELSMLKNCPREPVLTVFSFEGSCCFKGYEVLKPGVQAGGYWKQELGSAVCHLLSISSAVCPAFLDSKLEFHGWQSLAGQALARPSLGLQGLPKI